MVSQQQINPGHPAVHRPRATVREEAAGGGGVGVGQRTVDTGGVRAQRLAVLDHRVGRRLPAGHLPGGHGTEEHQERGQERADGLAAAAAAVIPRAGRWSRA